jgi:hypothetical protein
MNYFEELLIEVIRLSNEPREGYAMAPFDLNKSKTTKLKHGVTKLSGVKQREIEAWIVAHGGKLPAFDGVARTATGAEKETPGPLICELPGGGRMIFHGDDAAEKAADFWLRISAKERGAAMAKALPIADAVVADALKKAP